MPRTVAGYLLLAKNNFCSRFKPNFPKNHWSIQVVLEIVLTVTGVVAVAKKNSTLRFSGKLMLLSLDRRLSSMLQKFGEQSGVVCDKLENRLYLLFPCLCV